MFQLSLFHKKSILAYWLILKVCFTFIFYPKMGFRKEKSNFGLLSPLFDGILFLNIHPLPLKLFNENIPFYTYAALFFFKDTPAEAIPAPIPAETVEASTQTDPLNIPAQPHPQEIDEGMLANPQGKLTFYRIRHSFPHLNAHFFFKKHQLMCSQKRFLLNPLRLQLKPRTFQPNLTHKKSILTCWPTLKVWCTLLFLFSLSGSS